MKILRLKKEEIKDLARGYGACFATDRITVGGLKVGYMYNEPPDFPSHSGWTFMAGDESQEYVDDPNNWEIYDVNTIANYDLEIIPFLDSPNNSILERGNKTGKFVKIK